MTLATSCTTFDDNKELLDPLHRIEEESLFCERFERLFSFHLLFHISCILLLTLQIAIFVGLMIYQPKSPYVAALLFSCILTLFSYLILLFYYQAKKPQDLLDLRRYFVQACRKEIESKRPNQEEHLFLAKAAESLTGKLAQTQFYFNQTSFLYACVRLLSFKDVEKMQELLMYTAIQEHIEKIKKDPLDAQTHFSLAKSYLGMYRLYQSPLQESFSRFWIVKKIIRSEKRLKRVEAALVLALEELKIGLSSNPQNHWGLLELANCYRETAQKDLELETLKKLSATFTADAELLLRMGKIYFQLGMISDGLEIFSRLKHMNVHLSFELLDSYNAYLKQL